jgi:integrase
VLPTFAPFTLREITTGRVERFLKAQAAKSYARAKHSRTLLNLLMNFALRHDAIPRNPVAGTSRLPKPKTKPRALTDAEIARIRETIATRRRGPGVHGPKPDSRTSDIIEVLIGTACRIGEVLALRVCDVKLDGAVPTVSINGTIVVRDGVKVYRQDHPKTESSIRTVPIPPFLHDVLTSRLAELGDVDPEMAGCTPRRALSGSRSRRRARCGCDSPRPRWRCSIGSMTSCAPCGSHQAGWATRP